MLAGTFFLLLVYYAYVFNLKTVTVQSSETLVNQITWLHISECNTVRNFPRGVEMAAENWLDFMYE
jgi:hypothetical protein